MLSQRKDFLYQKSHCFEYFYIAPPKSKFMRPNMEPVFGLRKLMIHDTTEYVILCFTKNGVTSTLG